MSYQRGSLVVYGIHGVCQIMDIELRTVNRQKVVYYVLQPVDQPESRFYIPTQNQVAVGKLSPIMDKNSVEQLLQDRDIESQTWIEDENQRKQYYKSVIGSGDRAALIGTIRLLYLHKKQQQASGRKFHLCDENFLRDAERLIGSELSLVLEIPKEQVGPYIRDFLEKTDT